MNILVVGGAGYIGGAVTDLLLSTSHSVRVYDNLLFEEMYRKDINFTLGDVRDRRALQKQLDWADCVIWLAAIVGDGACAVNPQLTDEINEKSVEFLANNFSGRIIFPSTCSVYGAQEGLLTEGSPTNPLSIYAATKLKAEEHLVGKNALIFRLGTLFGVGDSYSRIRLDLVVNVMTARAYTEGKLKVFGGEQWRPLLHVKDVASAMYEAISSDLTGIYNISTGNMKISDLAEKVREVIPCTIEYEDMKFEDARNYRVSTEKLQNVSGTFFPYPVWHDSKTVEDGINEIKELLKDGRIKDWNNPRFSNQAFMEVVHGT